METNPQPKLRFHGVDFPHVSLHSDSPYTPDIGEVKINIEPKFFIPDDSKNRFDIVMDVTVFVEGCFTMEVMAVGHFEFSVEEVSEEVRRKFINANSTAIMFPYVRAFISTFTSNVGKVTSPIVLPARFFKGELEEIKE